jgi:hypothetical protein
MKTPVQQLITELRELHPEFFDVHTDKGRQFLNNFHKYIAIEKELIVQTYNEGALDGLQLGEEFYKITFKPLDYDTR